MILDAAWQARWRASCALATLVALSLVAGEARASGVDLFGLGARGGALAGTVAAAPDVGYAAVYYNPAALAFESAPSFALGFASAHFDLQINGAARDVSSAPALVIGLSVPLPFGGWLARRIAVGLGFVLPTTSLLTADIPRPADERFVVVENRSQTVSIQGGVGVRITDWLSLGAGALALAELFGAIDVAPNVTGRIGADVRDEVVADYAFFAGVLVRPLDELTVSVAYRDRSTASFELPISVSLGEDFTIPIPTLDIAGTAQFDPRQVAVDVGAHLPHEVFLGAGVTWKQWSEFINPIVYTAVPEDFPEQPPPRFEDIVVVRLGAEWRAALPHDFTLTPRAGFTWEPSPVPEQRGLHNYLDSDRFISAVGLGARWGGFALETAFQWHAMPQRTDTKDPERLAAEQPARAELAQNAGYPDIRHGGSVYHWQIEAAVAF